MTDTLTRSAQPEVAALDAYSQVVVSVAEQLTPRVAALQVSRRRRDGSLAAGAGSAVVFTNDGFLLTNAHVVGKAEAGQVAFADGTTVPFRVVGSDPLSDLAVVRADGAPRRRRGWVRPRSSEWDNWWWRSATPSDWPAPSPPEWSVPWAARCRPEQGRTCASSMT